MISSTLVVFAALAASIANASPIPFSNSGPTATAKASLLPVCSPPGSPVRPKTSEIHDSCKDPGDRAMDDTGFAHHDRIGTPAKRTSAVMNTARCKQDEPPHPSASDFAGIPQPQSKPVSASNSAVDYQQVVKDRDQDAVSASESAAHCRQYITSHGLDADDSDKVETGRSGEYNTGDQTSGDLRRHPHHHHQKREGTDCSIAAGGVLCKVKGDAESVQGFEASLLEPNIPTHIANID